MIGIYAIKNIINNKMYIGQSLDIEKRFNMHIFNSENKSNKKIYNYHLYKAFRKFGLENFKFIILEECLKNELLEKEILYYNIYKPEYNNIQPNLNPMFDEKIKAKHQKSLMNLEYRKEREKTSRNYWVKATLEERNKMLSTLVVRNPSVMKPITLTNNNKKLEFDCIKSAARFISNIYDINIATAEQGIQRRLQKITNTHYKGYVISAVNPVSTISESGE
jgi:group I intron endonuclease